MSGDYTWSGLTITSNSLPSVAGRSLRRAVYVGVMTTKGENVAFKKYLLVVIALGVSGCSSVTQLVGSTQPIKFDDTKMITKDVYTQTRNTNGVVLMDINWGRQWRCGGHENAQLIGLAFDKLPMSNINNDTKPSFVVKSPSRLMVDPVFINYAFSLEPGEYAISAFSIKVADSVSKVGFLTARRDQLYQNGEPIGGSFIVMPNETVFIGNFYMDCASPYAPRLWRYYPKDREAFNEQIKEYKRSFPYLDLVAVKFRLFKTKEFGYDYELSP